MTLALPLRIGWRSLWRRPRRTMLGALAFGFGVCVLLVVLGLGAGARLPAVEDAADRMLATAVLLLAALAVLNTELLAVLERRRELGVLAALGMRPRQLAATVMVESLLLSGLGALLGSAAAWGLLRHVAADGLDLSVAGVRVVIPAAAAPPQLPPGRAGMAALLIGVLALLAGLYPALRAARTRPGAVAEG